MTGTHIYGVGIDLLSFGKMDRLLAHGAESLGNIFSHEELTYCRQQARPVQHFAARFAAKEAAMKSLGIGMLDIGRMSELSVSQLPSGQPVFAAEGKAQAIMRRKKIANVHLSMSHCTDYAIAIAMAVSE